MCIRVHPWLILPPVCEILAMLRVLIEWPRMDTDAHRSESDATEAVIGSAFEVANVLGSGFLEKVYERALLKPCLVISWTLPGLSLRASRLRVKIVSLAPPRLLGQILGQE